MHVFFILKIITVKIAKQLADLDYESLIATKKLFLQNDIAKLQETTEFELSNLIIRW